MAFCGVFSWNERIYSVFQALFKANLAVKLDGLSRSEWVGMLRFRQLNYIFESMKKYQQLDLSRYDSAIVFISMPSEYPVDETEMDSFKSNVQQLLGYKNILWGNIKTTDDSKEIEVMLMLNKTWLNPILYRIYEREKQMAAKG